MPKEEWGVKRVCPTTGKRFYDLNKSPVVSPYTGEVVDIDAARRKGPAIETKQPSKPKAKANALAEDAETDNDILGDDDDSELEGDLLEDDDDDSVSLDDIADVSDKDDD